ncbi:MAG: glycosyltransferase [Flavobacteriales bacterium]|nr:glycosyltransferase [Flavobacteriales bacterium]
MPSTFDLCIVLPSYNESKFFRFQEYSTYLEEHPGTLLCFVNDGSTDDTLNVLKSLHQNFPDQVEIISSEKNLGKAEAVRKGVLYCNDKFDYPYIAYLDTDLAVSLTECSSLTKYLQEDAIFCFGSRILRIGSTIERKRSRFLIGRFIATIISEMLSLKVYDTQCGCKLFTKELSAQLFEDPFISKWLFDVEIFYRLLELYGKEDAIAKMTEVPLAKWIDRGKSKVKFTYFFNLWLDLYKIGRRYRHALTKN